jgi:hypothetical protein
MYQWKLSKLSYLEPIKMQNCATLDTNKKVFVSTENLFLTHVVEWRIFLSSELTRF